MPLGSQPPDLTVNGFPAVCPAVKGKIQLGSFQINDIFRHKTGLFRRKIFPELQVIKPHMNHLFQRTHLNCTQDRTAGHCPRRHFHAMHRPLKNPFDAGIQRIFHPLDHFPGPIHKNQIHPGRRRHPLLTGETGPDRHIKRFRYREHLHRRQLRRTAGHLCRGKQGPADRKLPDCTTLGKLPIGAIHLVPPGITPFFKTFGSRIFRRFAANHRSRRKQKACKNFCNTRLHNTSCIGKSFRHFNNYTTKC